MHYNNDVMGLGTKLRLALLVPSSEKVSASRNEIVWNNVMVKQQWGGGRGEEGRRHSGLGPGHHARKGFLILSGQTIMLHPKVSQY